MVDGKGDIPAQVEASFASRGLGGDKQEEIRKDFQAVILAVDIGQARGNHRDCSQDEDVGLVGLVAFLGHFLQEIWQVPRDAVGECGKGFLFLHFLRFLDFRSGGIVGIGGYAGFDAQWSRCEANSVVFSELEEGFDGDAAASGVEAVVVLFVGLSGIVFRMEAAETVEEAPATLPELFGEGEAEVTPGGVSVGDVDAGVFYPPGDDFYIVGTVLPRLYGLGLRLLGLVEPEFGVELLLCHGLLELRGEVCTAVVR